MAGPEPLVDICPLGVILRKLISAAVDAAIDDVDGDDGGDDRGEIDDDG